ncbi:DNA-protecting protein DprA [Candidatus Kuenenbacteria bacterium CG10_big_fil_rev_8_21_14_0_10_36_11]|uniref:DNA-protecting protein DprA n=1 Tax=Candidatus Kuenenbacteria bacterium CG10_big_fil_rev_8_21_14_0_10_36_11 TaxID=1974618 RepID=A0A2M6WA98_9BACT|nr:MAG: DNA-protecting protein DprA [Candidatus Kuenenbacteria bacterium CG10_big_fil_rev_8_21_14_0_10_36_11]
MSNQTVNNNFLENPELRYWIGFSMLPKIGPMRMKRIWHYFQSMQLAWSAEMIDLTQAGLEEQIAEEIILKRGDIDLNNILEIMARENIKAVTLADDFYPKLLQEIYAPPPILFYQGEFNSAKDEFSLAIVGTRKLSNYGRQVTPEITKALAESGLVIISGLALGIDSIAHETALESGGRTIAVLGSGLDREHIYPAANYNLCAKIIASGGAIISEYPPGTESLRQHFPQRNRIISGLSLGTLIIEAPEESGALLTARFALEQNREIFAIPGSIYSPNSLGPNNLIRMGAKLVTRAEDILEALDLNLVKEYVETKKIIPDSPEEAKILAHLSHEPIHFNELVKLTKLDTSVLNSTLTLMEMKGRVRNLGSLMYVIK